MKRNNLVKLTAIVIIMVFALTTISITASAEDRASYLRRRANEAADIFREMGFAENSAAIRICQLIYENSNGTLTRGTFLHDSTNGQTYYLLEPNGYSSDYYGSDGSYYYGEDFYDGQYYWYWDRYYQKYYMFDRNGKKTWKKDNDSSDTKKTNGVVYRDLTNGNKAVSAGYNTYTTLGQNIKDYNYTYLGVNLYAGRIYGLDCSDMNEVNTLAHIINSYIPDADLVGKASFGWSILDLGGGIPTKAVQYYSYYDPNSYNDWDMQEFCKELIFRYYAEQKGGNPYVGRILPDGYGYIHAHNSYQAEFSQSQNGPAYTYPDLYSSRKSKYHSPY